MNYKKIWIVFLIITGEAELLAYTSTIDNRTSENLQVSVKTGTYNSPLLVPAQTTFPKVYGGYCFYSVNLSPLGGDLAHATYEYIPEKVPYCDNLALRVTRIGDDLKLEKEKIT
jgi:hypothetical protein